MKLLSKVVPRDGGKRPKKPKSVEKTNGSQQAEIGQEAEKESDGQNQLRSRIGVGWPKSIEKPNESRLVGVGRIYIYTQHSF